MNIEQELRRSPLLMSRFDTALLVVDMQSSLLKFIPEHERIAFNIGRLLDGAKLFDMAISGTEQYPKGLGGTDPALAARLPELPSKTRFSCLECASVFDHFTQRQCSKILVVGIEAHVCVQQTVLDLLSESFEIYIAVDAVGSRYEVDQRIALHRMELAGAMLTTTEAALFEWCESSADPHFKAISALIKAGADFK